MTSEKMIICTNCKIDITEDINKIIQKARQDFEKEIDDTKNWFNGFCNIQEERRVWLGIIETKLEELKQKLKSEKREKLK